MSPVFADTFYFIALLNADDEAHAAAHEFAGEAGIALVTTAWVLTELANGLAETDGRQIFEQLLEEQLIHADEDLWRRGVELYSAREDKGWSLTDCISFVVMRDQSISEALTGDHHFTQAGFVALLQPE